jgi:Zn-dependent peptidase ImmA (M78 family)
MINLLHSELKKKYLNQIPVPIIALARELGLSIYETDGFKKNESGSIIKESDGFNIYLNITDTPERKRFTIAHEIAHFLLHQDLLLEGEELVDNIKQPIDKLNRSKLPNLTQKEKSREIEANQFAAELLMPEDAFKDAWEYAQSVEQVAQKFNVSPSAITIRAKELLGIFMS